MRVASPTGDDEATASVAVRLTTSTLERMSDLSSEQRLEKHRTLAAWLEWQLTQERRTIRELEVQVEQDRKRRERAHAEMHWKIQPARADEGHPMLHRGGCTLFGNPMGYLNREEALIALHDEGIGAECCTICRPETGLRT